MEQTIEMKTTGLYPHHNSHDFCDACGMPGSQRISQGYGRAICYPCQCQEARGIRPETSPNARRIAFCRGLGR